MPGNNPVFGRISKELEQGYAGFGKAPSGQAYGYAPPTPVNPQDTTTGGPVTAEALERAYTGSSAGPIDTGRLTLDDVVMKTLGLFVLLVAAGAVSWAACRGNLTLTQPLWMGGMVVGLALGFAISFMKKVSVPLIVTYAVVEGVFLGAFSQYVDRLYPGLIATAVVATLCTFAGMFVGYQSGLIKVTSRSRRIFAMMGLGYFLFSVVQVVLLMTGTIHGWGFGGSGMLGIGISVLGVGLASYSLAVDFDTVDQAVAMGAPRHYSWLLAHGLIVSLVWLYIEIVRLLARLRD